MKRANQFLSVLLALTMALSLAVTASASWPMYGGNSDHNAVVSGAPAASSAEPVGTAVSLGSSGGWDGIDNVPVMQTVTNSDGTKTTYAYILYDGKGSIGAQVAKVRCDDGSVVWKTPAQQNPNSLNAKSGFQLSTPCLDEAAETLYVGVISSYTYDEDTDAYLQNTKGKILALTDLDHADGPTVEEVLLNIDGQINTPIVKYGDYLYFGTWAGGSDPSTYYQITADGSTVNQLSTTSYGFYWAGAVVSGVSDSNQNGSYVYFGCDDARLYYAPVDHFTRGGFISLTDTERGGVSDAGDVRSTVMLDGDDLYFTSKGTGSNGYLWCCEIGSGGAPSIRWHLRLNGTSTSTPTLVRDGGAVSIYTGYYNGFSDGGVEVTTFSEGTAPTGTATLVSGFPVQCPVLYSNGYVYFNTNSSTGRGYCYDAGGQADTPVWKTADDTYALGGMACDNGYLVFGNDHNNLYIVGP